ncbi:MAG: hypothetical protein ABSG69_08205, partial [Candidatus Acidiferrum sp.]
MTKRNLLFVTCMAALLLAVSGSLAIAFGRAKGAASPPPAKTAATQPTADAAGLATEPTVAEADAFIAKSEDKLF